jgi:hypothetical protein
MRFALLLLAGLLMSCQQPAPRYIVTTGQSDIKVPIETMSISITVRSKEKDLTEANQLTRKSVLSMFRTFKKYGIPDSAFVTSSNNASDKHESYRDDQMAEVQYSGDLELSDSKMFDPIFNELVALKNVSVRIDGFHSGKIDDFKKLSYEASIKSARKEAELLLSGTGVKVGRILKVLKDQGDAFEEYDDFEKHVEKTLVHRPIVMQDVFSPDLEQTFRRKYFEVSSSVTVMFELE